MRVLKPRLFIAFGSALVVITVAVIDTGRTSPGPVSAVHGNISSCNDCHGGWFESMDDACLACHERIESESALHATFDARCGLCHSEHHGPDYAVVNRQSFAQAGIADPNAFDHGPIGFAMEGRHLELDCAKCHKNAQVAVLPEGQTRYLGLDRECAACHEDRHEGRMLLSCEACHGQKDFKQLEPGGHDEHLPLTGAHAEVACRDCHALEVLGAVRKPRARSCADCHESPHRAAFEESCDACHEVESFRDKLREITPEQHARSGFALDAPHDQAFCADCHKEAQTFAERYPGRRPQQCEACHADAHEGYFDKQAGGCAECHSGTSFSGSSGAEFDHGRWTRFGLIGAHAQAECEACHAPTPKPDRFGRTFGRVKGYSGCASCHNDPHQRRFETGCESCHAQTSFRTFPDGFDHGRWTGFALIGAHGEARCSACHEPLRKPDEFGRTWKPAKGNRCADCHDDPHAGQLPMRCDRCHKSADEFGKVTFNHDLQSRFQLGKSHRGVSCDACHKKERGVVRYRPLNTQCDACHNAQKDPFRR
jgi:hypothetical protein